MGWKGFITESKLFMSYAVGSRSRKVKFWLAFPGAAIRFYWYCLRDWWPKYLGG